MLIDSRSNNALWEQMPYIVTPIARQLNRLMREESGTSEEFDALTYVSEALVKFELTVLLAILERSDPIEAGRLGFSVTRNDGVGTWADVMQKSLNYLSASGHQDNLSYTRSYTEKFAPGKKSVLETTQSIWGELGENDSSFFSKNRLGILQFFVTLRNRTRGHGATTRTQYESINTPLLEVLSWAIESSPFLTGELIRPLRLKEGGHYSCRLLKGVPTQTQVMVPVRYIDKSDALYFKVGVDYIQLPDFILYLREDDSCYFLNSKRKSNGCSDFLDYLTNKRTQHEVLSYVDRPAAKPASVTAGLDSLNWNDTPVNNLPAVDFTTYVNRKKYEDELYDYLAGKSVNFVSLKGVGGAGKTTLALRVLRRIANESESPEPARISFDLILWFSARDVDLDERAGPLARTRQVSSLASCAEMFCSLVEPIHERLRAEPPEEFFARILSQGSEKFLLVFDNFESFDDTPQLQQFVKKYLAYPSKALITTRENDFHGDVPIEISGLSRNEARDLILRTARRAACEPRIDETIVTRIFDVTLGNPYAIKLLVNEFAKSPSLDVILPRVINQDYLAALFRRAFDRCDDDGQYLFLLITLSPLARQERFTELACAGRGIAYDRARELITSSHLLDLPDSVNGVPVYRVSWAAQQFAKRMLIGSRTQRDVEQDVILLASFYENNLASSPWLSIYEFMQASDRVEGSPGNRAGDRNAKIVNFLLEHDVDVAAARAIQYAANVTFSPDDRRRALKRAVELDQSNSSIWLAWSAFEGTQGDYQFSLDLALRGADHGNALNTLVEVGRRVMSTLTNFKEVIPLKRRSVYTSSVIERLAGREDEFTAAAYSVLGWLYLVSDDRALAEEVVSRGVKLFPDSQDLINLQSRFRKSL